MQPVAFTLYINPVAKARPRVTWDGSGKAHGFTPGKTRDAEADIKRQIIDSLDLSKQSFDAGVPLKLEATFYRARPRRLAESVVMPVSRPDTDNLLKLLTDAMQGLIYPDDSQITSVETKKRYGEPPRIEVRLSVDE